MKKANLLFIVLAILILLLPSCYKEGSQPQKPDPTYPRRKISLTSAIGWVSLSPQTATRTYTYIEFRVPDSTFMLFEVKAGKNTARDSGNYSVNMNQLLFLSKKYFYLDNADNWQSEVKDKQLYNNCTYEIKSDTLNLKYRLPETNNFETVSFKAYLSPG